VGKKHTTELHATKVGLKAVNKIFIKWDCTLKDKLALLGLSDSEYKFILDDSNSVNFSDDINRRISYILNIYECLYVLFSNPENRHGFLKLSNRSNLFKGVPPMDYMIEHGTTSALSDVYHYLDGLRHY